MGLLAPEFTKPVTLKLTADDAKREAWGRVLSLGGATVGILGGLMLLRANPAARAIFTNEQPGTMKLTAAQATQDATGKSLALIGAVVGVAGSALVMSSNPKMRDKFSGTMQALPAALRDNKRLLAMTAIGVLTVGTVYLLKAQNKNALEERYR